MTRSEAIEKVLRYCGPMSEDELLRSMGGSVDEARAALADLRARRVVTHRCGIAGSAQPRRLELMVREGACE